MSKLKSRVVNSTESISRSRNGRIAIRSIDLLFFFFAITTHLASLLRGRERFIAPRNNAFVAPLSLGDVGPRSCPDYATLFGEESALFA